jgi:hypothetical protein
VGSRAYQVLGFDKATGGDEVVCQLVCARIIEPTSKADSLRVLAETGVAAASYPTLNRRLPVFAKPTFRQALSRACARHARLGPASLVLYDVALCISRPMATSAEKARGIPDRVIHYQHRHDRARRTLRGIDEQVGKAERAVDGKAAVKRNRFIKLTGATKSINRDLEAKARALAGWKGYTTNLTDQTAQFVIDAYHQLWRIEKSVRMSKHDLQARPIYHHTRESIEAHLSIVFAALAVSHWIEHQTGWSIKKFVRTARRYRTVKIQAGRQTLTAAEPLPDDLAEALTKIRGSGAH